MNQSASLCVLIGFLTLATTSFAENPKAYHPIKNTASKPYQILNLTITDPKGDRDLPIRVYLPKNLSQPTPVILFSHGLGGSPEYYRYVGEQWGRQYVTVLLQHPGSDSAVWKDLPAHKRLGAMMKAANAKNYLLRTKDVTTVLDQLDTWNQSEDHPLAQKMNLEKVGMSGHSFGARTTQAVSGQKTKRGKAPWHEPRIDAAIIMSPSTPKRETAQQAFGDIDMPWMLMTGTRDLVPIGGADMESRLAVFPALPPKNKYELVLFEAEHSIFSNENSRLNKRPPNPNHQRAILALSQAFWDTHLGDNPKAKKWLNTIGPASVLEEKDTWQTK